MLVIVGLDLLVGVGQAVHIAVVVAVDQVFPLHTGAVGGGGHIPAIVHLQIAGQVVAVLLGGLPGAGDCRVGVGLVLGGHGVARLLGGVQDGRPLGQGLHRLLDEVVAVGLGLVRVHILLGGVHLGVEVGGAIVHGVHILRIPGVAVVVQHVGHIVVPAAHADGHLPALEDAGVPHQQGHHQDGDHHADDRIQGRLALGGLLLLELLPLGLVQALVGVALARFLFSGCAHL